MDEAVWFYGSIRALPTSGCTGEDAAAAAAQIVQLFPSAVAGVVEGDAAHQRACLPGGGANPISLSFVLKGSQSGGRRAGRGSARADAVKRGAVAGGRARRGPERSR